VRAARVDRRTQWCAEDCPWYPVTFAGYELKCGGESCLNRFDSEIIKFPAHRPENSHLLVPWRPNTWIRRAKEENAIGAGGCREMRNSAVVPDECGARKDRSKAWQRQVPGETNIAILPFAFQSVRLIFVCLA